MSDGEVLIVVLILLVFIGAAVTHDGPRLHKRHHGNRPCDCHEAGT